MPFHCRDSQATDIKFKECSFSFLRTCSHIANNPKDQLDEILLVFMQLHRLNACFGSTQLEKLFFDVIRPPCKIYDYPTSLSQKIVIIYMAIHRCHDYLAYC
mmetsp:Transcript_5460/g.6791  ORF Transcript_5460/g.6791 Transcript_5460/m.6791 type:complete len:102 (+) Transcript_5460:887-1192(+)